MTSDGESRPTFENPFEDPGSAEERVFAVLLQTREPTAAPAIAERADCDAKTARKYLEWFVRLGIATEHDGEPVTYERNDGYFAWRRANELAASHSAQELAEEVRSLNERIERYQERYDATVPSEVDATSPPAGIDTETAFAELTDWSSLREEIQAHDRARRLQDDPDAAAV